MRRARFVALAAVAALAASACGHVETHEVVLRAETGVTGRDPDVYTEDRPPARPFYEVALLQVIGFGTDANPGDVTSGLVARAKVIGCDAIVRVRVDQGMSRASGFGVCVRWSPERPASPAAPPAAAPSPPAPATSASPTEL